MSQVNFRSGHRPISVTCHWMRRSSVNNYSLKYNLEKYDVSWKFIKSHCEILLLHAIITHVICICKKFKKLICLHFRKQKIRTRTLAMNLISLFERFRNSTDTSHEQRNAFGAVNNRLCTARGCTYWYSLVFCLLFYLLCVLNGMLF